MTDDHQADDDDQADDAEEPDGTGLAPHPAGPHGAGHDDATAGDPEWTDEP